MKRLFVCENCGKIFMASADETVQSCWGYDMCSDQCANEFMNRKKGKQEISENYIVINGEKAELTEKQLKALGIAHNRKNPFKRCKKYYCINATGEIYNYSGNGNAFDEIVYAESNYFNDEVFARQVALHQLLYRKLLKFAYDNECEDASEWDTHNQHWSIYYDCDDDKFVSDSWDTFKFASVYFNSEDAADRAIKEIVQPFVKEHPDFVW